MLCFWQSAVCGLRLGWYDEVVQRASWLAHDHPYRREVSLQIWRDRPDHGAFFMMCIG